MLDDLRKFAQLPFLIPPRRLLGKKASLVSENLRATMVDRTGTIKDPAVPNITILQPIPAVVSDPGSFADVCDAAAAELGLRAKATGLPIVLMYSGGLDSICVACALLKAGIPFTALGSNESINENPEFYREVMLNNPLVTPMTGNPLLFLSHHPDDYVFATGECGAHIMGTVFGWHHPGAVEKIRGGTIVSADVSGDIFRSKILFANADEPLKSMLMEVLDKCPVPIRTNYDAHWWKIFALKWQFVSFRMQLYAGRRSRNLFNFFMTEGFQQWALCNDATVKCPDFDWRNYKMPMRDYIYAVSHDKKAAYETPKRYSLERTYMKMGYLTETFITTKSGEVGFLFPRTLYLLREQLLNVKQ